ncbi:MAG: hypothetical protein AAF721_29170 [Myxococcota bacterium]
MRGRLTAVSFGLLLGAGACGDRDAAPERPAAVDSGGGAPASEGDAPAADPLLDAAEASIVDGVVSPAHVARIEASGAPQHARAARLLAVIDSPVAALPEAPVPPGDAPAMKAPTLPGAPVDPIDAPDPPADGGAGTSPAAVPPKSTPPALPPKAPAAGPRTVSSLKLKPNKRGATLTIRGSGKLMVGTANQLASGRVHLVVDQAKASGAAAASRPSVDGVAVTAVRKGQGTVQITVSLDPGWSLGSTRAFSGGVRVHFVKP